MTSTELYQAFLESFPAYEPMVLHHIKVDENRMKIITKQQKAFIFTISDGVIRLQTIK